MDYLTPSPNHWSLDIEADDLLPDVTQIWCVCIANRVTREEFAFMKRASFVEWLEENPDAHFVGHNIIAYDNEVLKKLWDIDLAPYGLIDTMVLSQWYDPRILGGHSLDAWGARLGYPKGSHTDFSRFSPEMLAYCRQDARLGARLYDALAQALRDMGFTETGARIMHEAWAIIQTKQKKNGFPLNVPAAEMLLAELRELEGKLKEEIYQLWPPELQIVKVCKNPVKKDGTLSANYQRHKETYPKVEIRGDEYDCWDWVEFNLGSPPQRTEKLMELGWKPTKFTPKTEKGGGGNPQIDEEALLDYANECGKREVQALAQWIVVNSRANNITTWLTAAAKTGKIHGTLFVAGTLRYKHSQPNTANIPAVKKDKEENIQYGAEGGWSHESRDLWWAGEDENYELVGVDAKGIQLRVLAHYVDTPSFTEAILSEDPHEANKKEMDLPSRAIAKTIIYALLMGAGDQKIATEAKVSLASAKGYKETFFSKVPVKSLIAKLKGQLRRTGRIELIEGSKIRVPSNHMVIPYLLQGDESRIMNLAMILIDQCIDKLRLRAWKVADIHDEQQYIVHKDDIEAFIKAALDSIRRAGEILGFKVPMEGDAKRGRTWAQTH